MIPYNTTFDCRISKENFDKLIKIDGLVLKGFDVYKNNELIARHINPDIYYLSKYAEERDILNLPRMEKDNSIKYL